jgi:signal transduction histidine kinase/DNA-binding NarL/FixJ family response regulator
MRKNLNKNPYLALVYLFFCSTCLFPTTIFAESTTDTVTAAYLFKLSENIHWPHHKEIANYRFHVIDGDKKVFAAMQSVARLKKLKQKNIKISYSSSAQFPDNAHIIFIAESRAELYQDILDRVEGKPVLLISEDLQKQRQVMINLFKTTDNKQRFQINKANIINQNLGIDPDIILLGGTEIDVAKLYRESQLSLRSQEQTLLKLENERRELEQTIARIRNEKTTLESSLSRLRQTIGEQSISIRSQEEKIAEEERRIAQLISQYEEQSRIISEQGRQIQNQQERNEKLVEQSQEQQTIISQRSAELEQQAKQIEERIAILGELDKRIAFQDEEIRQKEATLGQQAETISSQQALLYALSVIIALVVVMALMISRSNRQKKVANLLLLEQKQISERIAEELLLAKEEADAANRAKSTFLANMSHELRTPLNAVLGFSELMGKSANISPEQRQNLAVINRSGKHLLALINDVLDMSKVEAGHTELEIVPVDLDDLLTDISGIIRMRAESKNLQFKLIKQTDLPQYVRLDPGKLRQILINLLGNAVKFSELGDIILTVAANSVDEDKWSLNFTVKDSGFGIAEDSIKTIFEPFVQAGKSPTNQKGTGLGLAISKQFVELMGGQIDVRSVLGQGSEFAFDVLVAKAHADEIENAATMVNAVDKLADDQPLWRILIVEDEDDNRLLLRRLLEAVGFDVREADNGKKAVSLFQEWQPHLIWMDMRMPVMNGYEATRKIREVAGSEQVKILALTASAFAEQRQEIIEAGCDAVLYKPCSDKAIYQAMVEHLGVKYIYHEEKQAVEPQKNMLGQKDMVKLSDDLREALREAATSLHPETVAQIIEEIRKTEPETASGLTLLADDFRYDSILALLE